MNSHTKMLAKQFYIIKRAKYFEKKKRANTTQAVSSQIGKRQNILSAAKKTSKCEVNGNVRATTPIISLKQLKQKQI